MIVLISGNIVECVPVYTVLKNRFVQKLQIFACKLFKIRKYVLPNRYKRAVSSQMLAHYSKDGCEISESFRNIF